MPTLNKLHADWKDKGLVVLGVNDQEPDEVLPMYKKGTVTFPTVTDKDRKVRPQYGGAGIPFTVIIDRKGKVAAQALGTRPEKDFLVMLRRAGLKTQTTSRTK